MKSIKLLLAAASVLSATTVLAQETSVPAATTSDTMSQTATPDAATPDTTMSQTSSEPTPDGIDPTFTGPRIEGFGGADFQKYDFRPNPAGADRDHTGGVAGALAGFDIGFRNVVLGVFGSYALPTSNFCDQRPAGVSGRCVRPEREIEAGARIGFKGGDSFLGNRIMVYAKGAYVNTSVKVQSTFDEGGTFNTHRLIGGWRAGAGLEYAVTEHAYVKAEYDYTRTGRFSLEPYGFADTDYRQTKHQALAGFGVRF